MPFPTISWVWSPRHPHVAHFHMLGDFPVCEEFMWAWGFEFFSGVLSSKESPYSSVGQLWSAVSWCQLSPFPHFFLFYTDLLSPKGFSLPPFLLLLFFQVSIIWNVPLSQLLFSSYLYLHSFFFVSLVRGLSVLVIFFKEPDFGFIDWFLNNSVFNSIEFCSNFFIISFLLLTLYSVCSLSSFLRWKH